ncbi:MAG: galactokinase [Acidobacteria bacterium]|nr:galactokinase [Acidobacteriota bacterium]
MTRVVVRAPGRVNLIGDHTDYTGGLVLPMAIDRWTVIECAPRPGRIELASTDEPAPASVPLPVDVEPSSIEPRWARYVAAMARELHATTGIEGSVSTTIPIGSGLSSSAALLVATALALGADPEPVALAMAARRAEHAATGVPTGIMDQLCIASANAGHATLIDCHSLEVRHLPVPDGVSVVVRFVAPRTLEGSAYADRVAECARAEAEIGPLRLATPADVASISDPLVRRRARHVVTENARVRAFAEAMAGGRFAEAGDLMVEGHRSLADDFDTSTRAMDGAVESLSSLPGVFGARMTGGGFGGCVVALCEAGADVPGWVVRPTGRAYRTDDTVNDHS